MSNKRVYYICLVLVMCYVFNLNAQTNEQKALKNKREKLQEEIKEINRLLFAEKKEKGTVLDQMEALDKKINVRQQLIRVTNQESNLLSRQVNANIRNISKLRNDLKALKEDYATMIQKSYENKSQQSRLLFLLSSDNFFQAFKRLQYIKQYTKYRKEQGEHINTKANELQALNKEIEAQQKIKNQLVLENSSAKKVMIKEKQVQTELLNTIRKNESKYSSVIQKKKKEARKIDKEIERLIRKAIASSNKKSKKGTNTSKFILTPEAELIANNFSSNKGKLIWPVEKGIKSKGFGVYKDALYPGIKHQNNGVIIATSEGGTARAIFEGEVIAIISVPGGSKGVQVKHGNYISTYYNLSEVFVKKGDIVVVKEQLGKIYTSRFSGKTELKFYLYQDTTRLNPEEWIYQL